MRKIYKAGHVPAWIGDSAPVPEGWSLDINATTRKEVIQNVRQEGQEGREEEVTANTDILAMDKDQLEAFARSRLGIELDKRKRLERLQREVMEAME